MVAKYFPACPTAFSNTYSMAVFNSSRKIYSDDVEDIYIAVYDSRERSFRNAVLCNKGEEFRALESAVLADYPGCEIIDRDSAAIADRPCRECRFCTMVGDRGTCPGMYGALFNPGRVVFCHDKKLRETADA